MDCDNCGGKDCTDSFQGKHHGFYGVHGGYLDIEECRLCGQPHIFTSLNKAQLDAWKEREKKKREEWDKNRPKKCSHCGRDMSR